MQIEMIFLVLCWTVTGLITVKNSESDFSNAVNELYNNSDELQKLSEKFIKNKR